MSFQRARRSAGPLAVLLMVVFSTLPGCFGIANRCESNEHCPVPEQCNNSFIGICVLPPEGTATCTVDSDCPNNGACYAGFCPVAGAGPTPNFGCLSDHSQCPNTYCDFTGDCAPATAGRVIVPQNFNNEHVVLDATGVTELDGVEVIAGNLFIGEDCDGEQVGSIQSVEIVFTDLRIITGNLIIRRQKDATAIRFPSLVRVGGEIDTDGDADQINDFRVLDFPVLEKVRGPDAMQGFGQVDLQNNRLLNEVNMPLLSEVWSFQFEGPEPEGNGVATPNPIQLNLSSFQNVEWVWLFTNEVPVASLQLNMPPRPSYVWFEDFDIDINPWLASLEDVENDLTIRYASGTPTLSFPNLTQVGEELTLVYNQATSISAPNLHTSGPVEIDDNELLTTLSMPSLTTINGTLSISGNDVLDVCQAVAIRDQAGILPADATLTNNMGDATMCP